MAARFWVGGTGTWSATNTANWSLTSNGAGGASVPGAADAVNINAVSGTSFTVTIDTGYNPVIGSFTGPFATVTLDLNNQTLTTGTFIFSGAAPAVRTLAFGATGQINVTGNNAQVFSVQIDTGLTVTGSKNVYFTYTGGVGTRDIRTGPLSSIATNGLNYYIQGGTDTITMTGASGLVCKNLDFTGFAGTLNTNQTFAYGDVKFSTGMTLTAISTTWTFQGPSGGTQTLTMNGKSVPTNITVNSPGGTLVFADDILMDDTKTLTLTAGTLNTNGVIILVGIFSSAGAATRTLDMTNSQIGITGTGVCWNVSATMNLTSTGSTVVLSNNTTTNRTFAGGSKTYNNLVIGGNTSINTTIISFNNTFTGTISSTKTVAHTLQITGGTTQTVGGWTVSGSAGNLFTLTSNNTTPANLILTGGGTVNTVDYCNISYSNATPTATWYPGDNSIKGTSVTGWMFPAPPSNGNFFLLF